MFPFFFFYFFSTYPSLVLLFLLTIKKSSSCGPLSLQNYSPRIARLKQSHVGSSKGQKTAASDTAETTKLSKECHEEPVLLEFLSSMISAGSPIHGRPSRHLNLILNFPFASTPTTCPLLACVSIPQPHRGLTSPSLILTLSPTINGLTRSISHALQSQSLSVKQNATQRSEPSIRCTTPMLKWFTSPH